MRRLADRLGIRAPSLYKHFADKAAVETAVISEGFTELADAFERATAGAADPLLALAAAYREFARTQPHLYRLMTERPPLRTHANTTCGAVCAVVVIGSLLCCLRWCRGWWRWWW